MKILALDTSTKYLCLGLRDGRKEYSYRLEAGTGMSVIIADVIRQALDAARIKPLEIDYFACGIGPGSFTGTRIGVSAVKGMSWALAKPIAGISTLDILAGDVKDEGAVIMPVIDAKRGLVYCAAYKRARGGLKKTLRCLLLNRDELLKAIPAGSILTGDAVGLYGEEFTRSIPGVRLLDKEYWYPKPHNLMQIAAERVAAGRVSTAYDIKPLYLFPKECQIRK